MLGIDYITTGLYEIWGKKGDKCVWYTKSDRLQVQLSDEFKKLATARGITQQEIAEVERQLTSSTSQDLSSTICRFNQANDLAKYLEIITRKGSAHPLGFGLGGQIYLGNQEIAQCDSQLINSPQ
jgi:hypothetical protein